LVVDNGSTDGSVMAIRSRYPLIDVVETGANLGYAGGNNVGIRWALAHHADFILLLNNDTIVSPDLVGAFVKAVDLAPSHAVLGAKIYYCDSPETLWFAGGWWDDQSNSFKHLGQGQKDIGQFSHLAEVDYITGCALFADAITFQVVGLLDESFFLTYEETDWCYRARAKGLKCIVVPDASLCHKVSSSFGGVDTPLMTYFMQRNRLLWAKKHLPPKLRRRLHQEMVSTLFGALLPPWRPPDIEQPLFRGMMWALWAWLQNLRRGLANPINRATLVAFRDYYAGRYGDCPVEIRTLAAAERFSQSVSLQ
jgi:hypothetical protein